MRFDTLVIIWLAVSSVIGGTALIVDNSVMSPLLVMAVLAAFSLVFCALCCAWADRITAMNNKRIDEGRKQKRIKAERQRARREA